MLSSYYIIDKRDLVECVSRGKNKAENKQFKMKFLHLYTI